jgi:hypothetical protein
VGWTIGWMTLRGNIGSLAGLLLGTSAMGWLLVQAFDSRNEFLKVVAGLFNGRFRCSQHDRLH